MNSIDRWTQLIDKVMDVFLVNSPNRTGLGVAIGLGLHVLTLIFEPILQGWTYVNLQLPLWGWPVLGIVVMNLRTIGASLREETTGNEQLDRAIKVIRTARLPPAAERHQYVLLIAKVIDELKFDSRKSLGLRTD